MPSPKRKPLLAVLFGLLCLALAAAYDWYLSRYQRTLLFDAANLRLPPELEGAGPIRLVHFHDPACPCNVGNQQPLAELVERYAPQGVAFHAVQKPGSPALAIWDRQGRQAYFGPYSEGATCTSANGFVEPVLDALLKGRPVRAGGTLAEGCFCDWR